MKKTWIIATLALLSLSLSLPACHQNNNNGGDDKKPGGGEGPKKEKKHEVKTIEFLDAESFGHWTYFNFEKGEIVKKAPITEDLSSDASWDIAFHRYDIKTNGGVSGSGMAGGFESELTELQDLKSVQPTFLVDVQGEIISKFEFNNGKHVMEKTSTGLNPAVSGGSLEGKGLGWIDTTHGAMGPKYAINPHIFFIKTADGKTVAVKFTGFKSAEIKSGFVSFKYIFVD